MFSAKRADLAPIAFEEESSLIAHRGTLLWSPHFLFIGELEEDGPLDSARIAAHPLKRNTPLGVARRQDKLPFGATDRADNLLDDLRVGGWIGFHSYAAIIEGSPKTGGLESRAQGGGKP